MTVQDKKSAGVPVKTKRKISRLKNLRAKYADVLDEITRLEDQIQTEAVELETSFTYRGITTVYATGYPRTYWDGRGLAEYAKEHPEIEVYAKTAVSSPYAYLRY